jgi:hypothetical protein
LQYVRKRGADLVCHCPEPQSSGKQGDLILTPLELIDLLSDISAALIPPRLHRHRYYGVLAPNSPLRAAAVAMAQAQSRPTKLSSMRQSEAASVREPDWDFAPQVAPDNPLDQRISW